MAGLPPGEGAAAADRVEQERRAAQQQQHHHHQERPAESVAAHPTAIDATPVEPMKENRHAAKPKHGVSHA
jgi:hypothetical protein